MTLDEFLIDKRIVDRNIKNGRVDITRYQAMLAALPDLSSRLWRRSEGSEPLVAVSAETDATHTSPTRTESSAAARLQPTHLG